jgi:hypothetical protein
MLPNCGQVDELIGMRSDTEEDLLDMLHSRQLAWRLAQIAESLANAPAPLRAGGSGDACEAEDEDEETQKAQMAELMAERELCKHELERRQRMILVREKAQAARDLKEAMKESGRKASEAKEIGDAGTLPSPRDKPAGAAGVGDVSGSENATEGASDSGKRTVDELEDEVDANREVSKAKELVDLKRAEVTRYFNRRILCGDSTMRIFAFFPCAQWTLLPIDLNVMGNVNCCCSSGRAYRCRARSAAAEGVGAPQ